jgi:hypothetical protein
MICFADRRPGGSARSDPRHNYEQPDGHPFAEPRSTLDKRKRSSRTTILR